MEDSGQKKKRAYSVSSLTSPSSSGRNNNGETGTSLSVAISSTDVAKHTAKRQATDPNGDQKQHASQNSQERSVSSPTVKSNGPVTLRLLVATKHAGSLIGRGGCMVAEIRDGAGVRATVSENIAGAPDRIFTAVGGPSQLANAFGRVARVLAGAEVDEGSGPKTDPETRQLTFRLLMPNEMMGSVIGKQAAKIKEIQKTTGARLSAMEGLLPDSTERKLSVIGIAESLEGAIKEIAQIMQEYPERAAGNVPFRPRPFMSSHPPSSSSASSSSRTPRSGSSRPPPLPHPTVFTGYPPAFPVSVSPFDHQHQHLTHLPNGYQGFVIESYPGAPSPTAKTSPPALLQHSANGSPPTISYAYSPHSATAYFQPPGQQEPLALPPSTSTASPSSLSSSAYLVSYPPHLLSPLPPPSPVPGGPGGLVTQQLSIPKKFVGHIIGKGGRSIAEIRGTSGCDVQIADAGSGQNGDAEDRLVTITGSHPGTQAAIQMIYAKMKV